VAVAVVVVIVASVVGALVAVNISLLVYIQSFKGVAVSFATLSQPGK
jgi:hypothetical protein